MARQLYLPQILDVLAGGVPPIESRVAREGHFSISRATVLNIAVIL